MVMRHLKTKTTKIAVPDVLEMAIVKIRAELEIDWEAACEHLAELADPNGKKFKQAVNREANRRYKSRHMAELNKAKKTLEDKGYSEGEGIGRKIGRALGYDQATKARARSNRVYCENSITETFPAWSTVPFQQKPPSPVNSTSTEYTGSRTTALETLIDHPPFVN